MSGLSSSNAHDLIDFQNVKMLVGAFEKESRKYCVFITVSMSKLRDITPLPCQLVIWEQGTGIIWSSIGIKLNKEIFLSLMSSFEVIPSASRSPLQCFWAECSPLAVAMSRCAPDNIYWGRKLRGAAKTRGWCRTTAALRPSTSIPHRLWQYCSVIQGTHPVKTNHTVGFYYFFRK